MDIEKIERVGVALGVVIVCSITVLSFLYFIREEPSAIPLAFIPIGGAAIYILLSRREDKPIKIIPRSSLEFVLTNLGFLILYLAVLFAITGYLFIKVAFLVLYLLIIAFTTWGFIAKKIHN